jgi:hypothetical protein
MSDSTLVEMPVVDSGVYSSCNEFPRIPRPVLSDERSFRISFNE